MDPPISSALLPMALVNAKRVATLMAYCILPGIHHCEGATIRIEASDKRDEKLIILTGQIYRPDAQTFSDITNSIPAATVVLDSPGGSVAAGVAIGRSVRQKGYYTAVRSKAFCASSCALIWLAGVQRFAERSSFLGFHTAYIPKNGIRQKSDAANDFIGAYLNELGLNASAIAYVTAAPPDQILRLGTEMANAIGINYRSMEESADIVLRNDW